jgi:hypothetical protein
MPYSRLPVIWPPSMTVPAATPFRESRKTPCPALLRMTLYY